MTVVAMYEDGSIFTTVDGRWSAFPRDKKIDSLGIYDINEEYHVLAGYDCWFFSDLGIASKNVGRNVWEGRIIAGFNKETGEGKVILAYVDGRVVEEECFLQDYLSLFSADAFIGL